jgi:anti-sigma B factor antagonist
VQIAIIDHQHAKVLSLGGEVDLYTSPDLRQSLLLLVQGKADPIVIDFSGVSYIDSSGIATFVEGLKFMKAYGGSLKFVAVPERVMEIFRFAKLDKVFEIRGSVEDAIAR